MRIDAYLKIGLEIYEMTFKSEWSGKRWHYLFRNFPFILLKKSLNKLDAEFLSSKFSRFIKGCSPLILLQLI